MTPLVIIAGALITALIIRILLMIPRKCRECGHRARVLSRNRVCAACLDQKFRGIRRRAEILHYARRMQQPYKKKK